MNRRPGNEPLVSIVTPCLNMGDRLLRCIHSVRSQTYQAIEHIVVDGGSSDETLEILQSSPHLSWTSEPDRGQSDAINKGLRMATGSILGWLNADDELLPDAVERVVAALRASPTAGLVFGDIELVEAGVPSRVRPNPTFSFDVMWKGNTISQPGTFWTRDAQERVGLLDEDFNLTMDYEYWLRLGRASIEGIYVPEVLARFEVHPQSKTGSAGSLAFAQEEARALSKHGEHHGSAMAIDRWYWTSTIDAVRAELDASRLSAAAQIARAARPRMRPALSRTRGFIWLAARAPRLARRLSGLLQG